MPLSTQAIRMVKSPLHYTVSRMIVSRDTIPQPTTWLKQREIRGTVIEGNRDQDGQGDCMPGGAFLPGGLLVPLRHAALVCPRASKSKVNKNRMFSLLGWVLACVESSLLRLLIFYLLYLGWKEPLVLLAVPECTIPCSNFDVNKSYCPWISPGLCMHICKLIGFGDGIPSVVIF